MFSSDEPGLDRQKHGNEVQSNEERGCCWIWKDEERDEVLETYSGQEGRKETWSARARREGELPSSLLQGVKTYKRPFLGFDDVLLTS